MQEIEKSTLPESGSWYWIQIEDNQEPQLAHFIPCSCKRGKDVHAIVVHPIPRHTHCLAWDEFQVQERIGEVVTDPPKPQPVAMLDCNQLLYLIHDLDEIQLLAGSNNDLEMIWELAKKWKAPLTQALDSANSAFYR
jgi:hypothetical protein